MTALAIVTLSMRATSNARVASLSSELVLAISLSGKNNYFKIYFKLNN